MRKIEWHLPLVIYPETTTPVSHNGQENTMRKIEYHAEVQYQTGQWTDMVKKPTLAEARDVALALVSRHTVYQKYRMWRVESEWTLVEGDGAEARPDEG